MVKKVIIVSKSLAYGGVENESVNVLNNLNKKYHPELIILRKPYHLVPNISRSANFTKLNCNYFTSPFTMYNIIRKHPSSVPLTIITFGIYSSLVSLIATFITSRRVCVIIYQAGVITQTIKNYPFPLIRFLFIKLLYPKADHFIVSSPYVKSDFLTLLPFSKNKITIIPSNMNAPEIIAPRRSTKIPHFIFVGRLVTVKNVQLIIKAAHLTRFPSKFLIVGDGPQKDQLVSLTNRLNLASRIQFLGFLEKPWDGIASSAYALILTSLSEGDPKVVLESASYGIPTLSVPFPGVNTIINHQKTGYIVENYTAQSLANAIDYFAKHPREVKKYGLAAKDKTLCRQSHLLTKHYENLINEI